MRPIIRGTHAPCGTFFKAAPQKRAVGPSIKNLYAKHETYHRRNQMSGNMQHPEEWVNP